MVIGILTGAGCLAAAALTGVLGPGAAAGAVRPIRVSTAQVSTAQVSTGAVRSVPAVGNPTGNVAVPAAGRAVNTKHPTRVIGHGTPASCTSASVVKAVAAGGIITFNCGPKPVTITMTATAKVVNTSHEVVLDGGGKVTLNGAGKTRILYMNTCDPKQKYTTSDCWEQQWPLLVVQNLTFKNAYSAVRQTATSNYGGGAIFDEGGQLKVVNSVFAGDRCYASGPDLGGGAVRAVGMYMGAVVYITHDTFSGNSCSNGAALSGLYARFGVFNSLFTNNKAIGWGANPASSGTPGGGSGGAIYTDGNHYSLIIAGTAMSGNTAREGGGAIFFVVDAGGGQLKIKYSKLSKNPSGQFQNAPGIFDSVDGAVTQPVVVHSTIG
jgi:hypothetical protein